MECLKRLGNPKDTEVIVIDNATTDGSVEAIKKQFPKIKLIANNDNNGFARGNNQGMSKAVGEWFLLLNSDAFVEPDCLAKAIEFTKRRPDADMFGCKLLNPDRTIQPSWGYFPTLRRLILFMSFIDNLPMIRSFTDAIHVRDISRYTEQETDWVMGAWVMLKKDVFVKTGGFDTNYFMYGEEMEWMYRAKQAGFKIWYTPEPAAVHLGGASTNGKGKAFASEMKGYLYWWSKHNPIWEQKLLPYILKYGCLWKSWVWGLLGNKEMAEANRFAAEAL